jgi:hypothetical protein
MILLHSMAIKSGESRWRFKKLALDEGFSHCLKSWVMVARQPRLNFLIFNF